MKSAKAPKKGKLKASNNANKTRKMTGTHKAVSKCK